MLLKEALSKFLTEKAKAEAPERHRLAERLLKEGDDEETAGFLNQLLDGIAGKAK